MSDVSTLPEEMLCLDLGMARTGIARASATARIAEPIETIETKNLYSKLKLLAEKNLVSSIVVGLPRTLDSNETDQTKWVRDQVENLKKEMPGVEFYFQDEALSSKIAAEQDKKSIERYGEDALAATVILQDFLDLVNDKRLQA